MPIAPTPYSIILYGSIYIESQCIRSFQILFKMQWTVVFFLLNIKNIAVVYFALKGINTSSLQKMHSIDCLG